jgi:hypothetical protein
MINAFVVDGLQAHYSFDTDASDDYSTNEGSLGGTAHIGSGASCQLNSCVCFDGDSDYVSVANPDFNYHLSNLTVCTFIFFNATTDQHQIFDHDNVHTCGVEMNIETDRDTDVHFKWEGTEDLESSGSSNFPQSQLFSACWVFEDNGAGSDATVQYYKNGTFIENDDFDAGVTTSRLTDANTSTFYIGTSDVTADWMEGCVDEYTIWNRTLSAAEILDWHDDIVAGTRWDATAKDLYVNGSHGSCNDSTTRANNDADNPWCTHQATQGNVQSGDVVYTCNGTYNESWYIIGQTFTDDVKFTCYPGDTCTMGSWTTTGTWTDLGGGLWDSGNLYGGANQSTRVYWANDTKFFTWSTEADFLTSTYNENSWYNSTTDSVVLNLPNGQDPNNFDIKITKSKYIIRIDGNTITSGKRVHIENYTFRYGNIYPIYVYDQGEVYIKNNYFYGGHKTIHVDGRDDSSHSNIYIGYNNFDGGLIEAYNEWYLEDMKNEREETDQIWVIDFDGNVTIEFNNVTYINGGFTLDTDDADECNNSRVRNNTFTYGRGSLLEIEKYCSNSIWSGNKITRSKLAISLAPADASDSETRCILRNNIVYIQEDELFDGVGDADSYTFKIENISGLAVRNWGIYNNTFVSNGRVINSIDPPEKSMLDVIWKDNIMRANDTYVIVASGLSTDDNFYDYNLYDTDAALIFSRWNNYTGTTYASLAVARASVDWDTTWDNNSIDADPLFLSIDPTSDDFLVPASNSPACGAGTDGGDIGAIPCSSNYEDNVNPDITFSNSSGNVSGQTALLNVTCSDNIKLQNISLYVNSSLNTTNSSPVNNTAWIYSFTVASYTNYSLYFECYDNNTNSNTSSAIWLNFNCVESWSCGDWSGICVDGDETRTCTDANSCGTTTDRPDISRACGGASGGGGGGSSSLPKENFIIHTDKIIIEEAFEGYSDYYEIIINASSLDTFQFDIPGRCVIEHESIKDEGVIKNKVSCEKTVDTFTDEIVITSSTWEDSIYLEVRPPAKSNFMSLLTGNVPFIPNTSISIGEFLLAIGLIAFIMFVFGGGFLLLIKK